MTTTVYTQSTCDRCRQVGRSEGVYSAPAGWIWLLEPDKDKKRHYCPACAAHIEAALKPPADKE